MTMEETINELQQIITDYSQKISNLSEADLSYRSSPTKWSKKEVLGHLIDSAQNNLRRFICGQYEATPPNIVYSQDFWVIANGYDSMKSDDIILLWKFINQRVAEVISNMPPESYKNECNTGKHEPELRTLEWLAVDYVKHMKHHLNQIIPGSFNIVYP